MINYSFFSKPNEINSYWAGFIAADGCIIDTDRSKRLSINLSSKDKNHLVLLSNLLDVPLYTYKTKQHDVSRLSLRSNKLCLDLENNFNITPRKSLTLKPPKLSAKLQRSFISGYFDGDGSLYVIRNKRYTYPGLSILGTEAMLLWIQQHILENVSEIMTLIKRKSIPDLRKLGRGSSRIIEYLDTEHKLLRKRIYDTNI
jgi:hypothetical protein